MISEFRSASALEAIASEPSGSNKPNSATRLADVQAWKKAVAQYQTPSAARASWQLVSSVGAYVALWALMYLSLSVSWWLTIPLAVLAGGILVRVFIVFHDCGHGSFFKSRRANDFWGVITGVLTLTPYFHWRWEHSLHHARAGHLERRGVGDIWTLTVQEYLESSRWRRFAYRLARNPIILFMVAPLFLFLCMQRVPAASANTRDRNSVWWTTFGGLGIAVALSAIFGFVPYLVIQLVTIAVASSAGVWLFYVQHQFEGAYWEREEWDYTDAALKGSSFYQLPRILQWFSGNIGFHHIHHLSPRVANYNLERCHRSDPIFHEVTPVTFWSSWKCATLRLWDEQSQKLVGFRGLKNRHRDQVG